MSIGAPRTVISRAQLARIMPAAEREGRLDLWHPHLDAAMLAWGVIRPNRMIYMLANIAEETGELAARVEDLRYSGARLMQVFPSLFRSLDAAEALAAQGPEAIANYVYSDHNRPPGARGGNVRPGDGWRYRGRGPMQLTWHDNYAAYFVDSGLPADSDPDLVLSPEHGAGSACWFVATRGCHALADRGLWRDYVRRINGATLNMALREHYRALAQATLAGLADPLDIVCIGDTGAAVRDVQRALARAGGGASLAADGEFGRETRRAVIAFQRRTGLPATGLADPETRAALAA
jgi:putative chitinase